MKLGHCRHCQAEVLWVRTINGRAMPLDVEPQTWGNVFVEYAGDGSGLVGHVATKSDPRPPGVAHVAHFATCPTLNKDLRPIPARKAPAAPASVPMSLFDTQGES